MTAYQIQPVNGTSAAEVLHYLNAMEPELFPRLEPRHIEKGYWWLARDAKRSIVGFAGLVPMTPFDGVGYLKRAFVLPPHRGRGIQQKFLTVREEWARTLGWTMLVAEAGPDNHISVSNLERAGFDRCNPEQCWGAPGSIYFVKRL